MGVVSGEAPRALNDTSIGIELKNAPARPAGGNLSRRLNPRKLVGIDSVSEWTLSRAMTSNRRMWWFMRYRAAA